MFNIFVKLSEFGFIFVASREELEQANQLVKELKASWPHEYVIRDSQGNDIDPKCYT